MGCFEGCEWIFFFLLPWIILVRSSIGTGTWIWGFSGLQGNLQPRRQLYWLVSGSLSNSGFYFSTPSHLHYTDYGVVLNIVANIENEKDLKEAQDLLQEYIVTMPLIEFPYSDEYCFAGLASGENRGSSRKRIQKPQEWYREVSRKISKST